MPVGKDVHAIGAGTQRFGHIPPHLDFLLLSCVLYVLADGEFQLSVFKGESAALGKHLACRCGNAHIDAAYARFGCDIAGNRKTNGKFLHQRD